MEDGQFIQFKAADGATHTTLKRFEIYGPVEASGSVMTLLPDGTEMGVNAFKQLFMDCTDLKTAPELPAETMKNGCYESMFEGCTSLETAPELPATSLANYCYINMFKGCSNLREIHVKFTSWHSNAKNGWVDGVSNGGDFYCPSSLAIDFGINRLPEDWEIHND